MPPTPLTVVEATSDYTATGYAVTLVAIDNVNGNNVIASTGRNLLIVQNPSGAEKAFAITSQPDPTYSRLGNVSMNIAAGATRVFPLSYAGWADGDGKINMTGHEDLRVGVLKLS